MRAGDAVLRQQAARPGSISSRYWAIASVFQTFAPSCVRQGTRIDGASSRSSLRASASSGETITSSNVEPGEARHQPAAQRPRRIVLAADSVSVAPRRDLAAASARAATAALRFLARTGWRRSASAAPVAGRRGDAKHDAKRTRSAARMACKLLSAASRVQHTHPLAACDVPRLPGAGRSRCGRCAPSAAPSLPMLLDPAFGAPAPDGGAPARRRLASARARRGDPRAARLGHRERASSTARACRSSRKSTAETPFATLRRFRKEGAGRAAARPGRRADVGPLRDAAARHRAHAAARPRRLRHRLAQRARRAARAPAASASTSTSST